jgi:hypothetical protein
LKKTLIYSFITMEAPIITCSDNWSFIEEQGMPAPRARSRTSSSERFVREILFDGPIDAEETELFTSMVNLKIAEDSPIAFPESLEITRSRTSSDEVFVQGILSPSQDMLDEPTYHDQGDKLMKHFDNLKTSGNNEYAPTVASTSPASTCRSTCGGERSIILVDLNHETYDWKNYLEDPSPESTKLKSIFRPTKKLKPPKPKPSDAVCLLFVDDMADPVKKKPKDKVSPAARLALGNVVTYASKRDQPVDYAKIFQDEGQIVAPSAGIRRHQMYCREEDINLSVIPSTPSSVAHTHYSLDANQLHNEKYEPSHNHNDQLKRSRRPSRFVRPKCPTRKAPAKPKRAPRRTTLKRAERQVYKPTKEDILCGRGGMTNKHPGNIRFRELVASAKNEYSLLGNKRKEKKQFSEGILRVIAEYGGRFLQKKGDNWIIVREAAARTKCSQALRE